MKAITISSLQNTHTLLTRISHHPWQCVFIVTECAGCIFALAVSLEAFVSLFFFLGTGDDPTQDPALAKGGLRLLILC